MLQLSKKLFYAIEAVLYIAYNAAHEPMSSKEIAGKQGMTARYLEQMMQKLVRAGVLRGVRGPHGGYVLAREKRRITLADICKALGDEEVIPSSTPLGDRIVVPALNQIQSSLFDQLGTMTIADLCEQATTHHVKKSMAERNDFTI